VTLRATKKYFDKFSLSPKHHSCQRIVENLLVTLCDFPDLALMEERRLKYRRVPQDLIAAKKPGQNSWRMTTAKFGEIADSSCPQDQRSSHGASPKEHFSNRAFANSKPLRLKTTRDRTRPIFRVFQELVLLAHTRRQNYKKRRLQIDSGAVLLPVERGTVEFEFRFGH
jgi:hypothetical protein